MVIAVGGCTLIGSAVYLVTGIEENLLVAAPGFTNRIGNGVGTDFPAFYAAAVETRAGRAAAVYEMDALGAAHRAVRGVDVLPYSWAYPPSFLLLILPLSLMPLLPAMWTWLAATTLALLAAATRLLPSPATPFLVLLFPGLTTSLVTGPTGTLTAAVVANGLALLPSRPWLAGAVLGLLGVKPHLGVLVPICLLAAGQRRALGGFVAMTAALVVASVAAFGTAPWMAFLDALPRHLAFLAAGRSPWSRMPTVFVAVRHATGVVALASAAQAITTVTVLVACALVWTRTTDPGARALALAAGIPLVGPYAYDYDTCALIVPILYLLRAAMAGDDPDAWGLGLIVLLWVTPLALWVVSAMLGQQIGPLLLGAALLASVGASRRTR